ncbi:MAG: ATP synthase F0 subunit C [Eubacterium sp.]|nr:ATP synthase F0 subunit C [Eubacterium sp.]
MKLFKKIPALLIMILLAAALSGFIKAPAKADTKKTVTVQAAEEATAEATVSSEAEATKAKAIGAAIVVGIAASAGAIGMGMSISKSSEAIARQPEAEGKIRTTLMLGLVFIETAIIYALIVAILIIFVM